ncbi:MAG: hypothetical protein H7061_05260 [Bdellovibrionaceae bacterium]|nr:hypothetical protein [Bdellovibrio sp.]
MKFIKLTFGLAASGQQNDIIQLIKNQGDEVIQTGDGLCVKSNNGKIKNGGKSQFVAATFLFVSHL